MLTRLVMASQIKCARWAFNCNTWIPSEKDVQLLTSGIDAEDKETIGKFVFKKDAKYALIGRFLVKKFITESTGIEWQDVKILRDTEHRKPYFPSDPRVQFNVSHSGDYVVLAGEINNQLHLGIDLMKMEIQRSTSVPEFFRLMSKQFAPEEWTVVQSQKTEAEQLAMFYRFWCLKESFTKATGTGITVDLRNICFHLNSLSLFENISLNDTEVFLEGKKLANWKFQESLIDKEHIVAVASNSSLGQLQEGSAFNHLSISQVMSNFQQITPLDELYSRQFMAKKSC